MQRVFAWSLQSRRLGVLGDGWNPKADYHLSIQDQINHTKMLFEHLLHSLALLMRGCTAAFQQRRVRDGVGLNGIGGENESVVDGLYLGIETLAASLSDYIHGQRTEADMQTRRMGCCTVRSYSLLTDMVLASLSEAGLPEDGTRSESVAEGLSQAFPETLSDLIWNQIRCHLLHLSFYTASILRVTPLG